MIGLPAGTRIWIVAGVTDMRRGFVGLAGMVQTALAENPFSGQVFLFRGRRGDLVKVLWWDGDGLCLFAKRLERGRFTWPQAASGTVSLTGGAALDVVGRDQLASSGAQLRAADGGVNEGLFHCAIFFADFEFSCAFFLHAKKVLAYCARLFLIWTRLMPLH
jgi:transposase